MIYALVRADRDRAGSCLLGGDARVREERHSILVVVVLGLGAAAPRTFYDPVVISVCALQGRLEGVMVEERGEGVVVDKEAARHVTYVASLAAQTRVQRRCRSRAEELVTTGFLEPRVRCLGPNRCSACQAC